MGLREQRGERTFGCKIGFTNRTICPSTMWCMTPCGATIWGYMYDKTVFDLAARD
ncbi:hypothetical protein RGCCGE502_19475 [Rhizobium grahamii CCGE 502]|uniref:Uncharacterized protein n=1 Tax=Rhizobium grahamii CCGE 502 TaxID=990285 RepID=S3HD09_9HYPH|nr:hypothetical protein RGCCGE502_19475 [Rhizobium grahamii CCGE 502]